MERPDPENPVLKAIRHAAIAGACEHWSRRDPRTAAGLRKVAAAHRAKATELLGAVVAEAG